MVKPAAGCQPLAYSSSEAVQTTGTVALTSPASLVERFGAAGMPSDQIRKLLSRAACMAAALGGSPGERAKLVRELVEKIIIDETTIIIKLRRGLLLGGDVPSCASDAASDSAVELMAAAAFTRRSGDGAKGKRQYGAEIRSGDGGACPRGGFINRA